MLSNVSDRVDPNEQPVPDVIVKYENGGAPPNHCNDQIDLAHETVSLNESHVKNDLYEENSRVLHEIMPVPRAEPRKSERRDRKRGRSVILNDIRDEMAAEKKAKQAKPDQKAQKSKRGRPKKK